MRNLLITFSFLVCTASAQNITDSLLLYYPMNGNANDLSGNDFHGIPSGVTSVPDRHGVPNSAYYFDGVDDYIDFPLNDTLKPDFPMTFAFWAKLKVIDIAKTRFSATDFLQNNYHGVWMRVNNQGYLGIAYGGGIGGCNPQNRRAYNAIEFPVDTGIWYHFAGVAYSANNMALYINCNDVGAVYSSGTGPLNIAYSNTAAGTLGRMDHNTAAGAVHYNWGTMDDFSFWERALSVAEIYTLCDSMPLISSNATWNCINGACIDPGNGTGMYNSYSNCNTNCIPSAVDDLPVHKEKILLRVVNMLGEEVSIKEKGLLFYIYYDGTVEKKFRTK